MLGAIFVDLKKYLKWPNGYDIAMTACHQLTLPLCLIKISNSSHTCPYLGALVGYSSLSTPGLLFTYCNLSFPSSPMLSPSVIGLSCKASFTEEP